MKQEFETTYEITFDKTKEYEDLYKKIKEELKNKKTKITFNDANLKISIGISYYDFTMFLSWDLRYQLPNKKNHKKLTKENNGIEHISYELSNKEVIVKAKQTDTLHLVLCSKERSVISYNKFHLNFHKSVEDSQKKAFAGKPKSREIIPNNITRETLIEHFATKAKKEGKPLRLILGEEHERSKVEQMIIDAINAGHISEGATLALEGINYETTQPDLDAWRTDGNPDSPPPEHVTASLSEAKTKLLSVAKKHGIRILAIDSENLSIPLGTPAENDYGRAREFNYVASNIIDHEVLRSKPLIVAVGAAHATTATVAMPPSDASSTGENRFSFGLNGLIPDSKTCLIVNVKELPKGASHSKSLVIHASSSQNAKLTLDADLIINTGDPRPIFQVEDQEETSKRIRDLNKKQKLINSEKSKPNSNGKDKTLKDNKNIKIHQWKKPESSPNKQEKPSVQNPARDTKKQSQSAQHSSVAPKTETSPAEVTLKPSWNTTHFITTYEIKLAKNMPEGFKASTYKDLKKGLIDTFNVLHRENPNSEILIRFDDTNLRIEIGYAYRDFCDLIATHTCRKFLPNEETRKLHNDTFTYQHANKRFEIVSAKSTPHTLESSKDSSHFVLNYGNKSFWNEASHSLSRPGVSFKNTPSPQSTKETFIADFAQVFQKNQHSFRLVIGEDSRYPDAPNMLRDAIKSGKISTGTTIVLEGFFYDRHQKALDKWIKSSEGTLLPLELKSYLASRPAVKEVLLAAKAKKLRILAISTEAVNALSGVEGAKARNYIAKEIIKHEVGNGAFVALVGTQQAANSTFTTTGKTEKVSGLGTLLDKTGTALVLDTNLSSPIAFNQIFAVHQSDNKLITLEAPIVIKASKNSSYSPWETTTERETRKAKEEADRKAEEARIAEEARKVEETRIGEETSKVEDALPKVGAEEKTINAENKQQKQKISYKNTVISGGMLLFGGAGAINSFKKGDTFNGVTGISETATGATALAAGLLSNKSQSVLHILAKTPALQKTAQHVIKGAGHFLKIVPFAGAAFSAIAAKQDINDIINASKSADAVGIVKATVNLALDVAMGVADLVPGVGTLASFSLLAARITAGLLIDQMCDPEAYKKTWALLEDSNSTWFDKALFAVGGSLQFSAKLSIIPSFSSSILESAYRIQKIGKNLSIQKKKQS